MTMRSRGRRTTLAIGAAVLVLTVTAAAAAVVVKQRLRGTSKAPRATGQATLMLTKLSKGTFLVIGRHLPRRHTFDVIVRGVKVGTLTTNGGGSGKAKFRTGGGRGNQLLGFDPRGAEVVVRDDTNGDDDLVGDMPDEGSAAGAFACCLPDDDGETECEELTPTACTNAGGTSSKATSCLPDPCATTPPPGTVCCIPGSAQGAFEDEDPEVECEDDISAAACTSAGGSFVMASSCEPNPCAPTPPPMQVVCCVPEDAGAEGDQGQNMGNGTECEILTPEVCAAEQGTATTATSCEPNPCQESPSGAFLSE